MAFTKRLLLALGALLVSSLPSQAWAEPNPTLRALQGGVETGTDDQGKVSRARVLELTGSAHIAGPTADVTLEFLLGTTNHAQDEIRLTLNLPPDAVITGYALDVGGVLIPGQLMEQNKARNVYEDQIRARVDPGLAEVTADNQFSTRVFPVTASAPRRVRVQFSVPIGPGKDFAFPLETLGEVGKASFTVQVDGAAAEPEVRFGNRRLQMTSDGAGWKGEWQASNAVLRNGLELSLPFAPGLQVSTHANGERFFTLLDSSGASGTAVAKGGRLRIYWDRSLSHGDDRTDLEAQVLAQLVEATRPTAIDLVTFASDAPLVTRLADDKALAAALDGVTYRGGTSLAGLDALDLPNATQCVIVFDGRLTIDQSAGFAPDCKLSAISAAPDADGARLGRLAGRTQGRFIRVQDGNVAESAEALAHPALAVTGLRGADGRNVPFRSLAAPDGGWLLVGPLPSGDRLTLSATTAGGERLSRSYTAAGPRTATDAPGALWAAQEMVDLADDPTRHDEMVEFARRYRVASQAMSFLVLERADQYVDAGLAPPPGFSKGWIDDYLRLKAGHDQQAENAKEERFGFVLGQWEQREAWWNRKFTPKPRAKYVADADSVDAAAEDLPPPPALSVAPMAAPPPPPPPPPPPRGGYAGEDAAIVVTGSRIERRDFESNSPIVTVAAETLELRGQPSSETDVDMLRQGGPGAAQPGRAIGLDVANLLGDRPYLAALDKAKTAERLAVLAEQEANFGKVPAFYLDTAEWFRLKGDKATAALLLLSALELPSANDETRQIVAFRLERDGAYDRAIDLAERLAAGATYRPQPKRALALALAARGQKADLERAFRLLGEVALDPAIRDFDGIEIIALAEANALIPAIDRAGGKWSLDKRLVGTLDTDMRVVIEWTADDADIDLWVDEPNRERVYYGAKLSSSGGQISNDMTDGYGPEEYVIHRAPKGTYEVRINGYDADRLNPNGGGRVLARLIRNFGRDGTKQVMVDAELGFQAGRDRNAEGGSKPVATLQVD